MNWQSIKMSEWLLLEKMKVPSSELENLKEEAG